jgi:hypothetical protein
MSSITRPDTPTQSISEDGGARERTIARNTVLGNESDGIRLITAPSVVVIGNQGAQQHVAAGRRARVGGHGISIRPEQRACPTRAHSRTFRVATPAVSSTSGHDRWTGARTAICCRRCTQPVIKDSTLVQNSRGDPTARSGRRSGARRPPRWSAKRRRAPPGSAQRLQVRDRLVPVPAVPGHVRVDAGLHGRDELGQLVLHGVVAREAELARDLVEGHPVVARVGVALAVGHRDLAEVLAHLAGCAAPRTSGRGTSTPATSAILSATYGRSFTSRGETRRATTGHARMASARQLSPQADLYPGVPSRSLLRARCCSCRSCTPGSQSLPNVADGPSRGLLGTWSSRRACTYARSCSIRACT